MFLAWVSINEIKISFTKFTVSLFIEKVDEVNN